MFDAQDLPARRATDGYVIAATSRKRAAGPSARSAHRALQAPAARRRRVRLVVGVHDAADLLAGADVPDSARVMIQDERTVAVGNLNATIPRSGRTADPYLNTRSSICGAAAWRRRVVRKPPAAEPSAVQWHHAAASGNQHHRSRTPGVRSARPCDHLLRRSRPLPSSRTAESGPRSGRSRHHQSISRRRAHRSEAKDPARGDRVQVVGSAVRGSRRQYAGRGVFRAEPRTSSRDDQKNLRMVERGVDQAGKKVSDAEAAMASTGRAECVVARRSTEHHGRQAQCAERNA